METLQWARRRLNGFLSADGGGQPVRALRTLLRAANDVLGEPVCSDVEWNARKGDHTTDSKPASSSSLEVPVVLYVAWDSPRAPIEDILKKLGVAYRVLDVGRDESMLSFLQTKAGREPPVLFVGDRPIGGVNEVEQADRAGTLKQMLDGAPLPS